MSTSYVGTELIDFLRKPAPPMLTQNRDLIVDNQATYSFNNVMANGTSNAEPTSSHP